MRPLTPRQQAVLSFVSEFSRERGFAPSLREIGEAVGLVNVSAVRGHVAALEKKGCLRKEPDQPRSISVVGPPSLMSRLKRKLHEFARTDEGVLHRVQYGVVLATRGLQPFLQHDARSCLEETLGRLGAEHGWRFIQRRIHPDHLVLAVEVWPNHSPELTAHRVRAATENALKRHGLRAVSHVWARGYAVTTDLGQLDEIVRQFMATSR
jgi:REP element-mobilizing transposase RayT